MGTHSGCLPRRRNVNATLVMPLTEVREFAPPRVPPPPNEARSTSNKGELVASLNERGARHAVLDTLKTRFELAGEFLPMLVHLVLEPGRE